MSRSANGAPGPGHRSRYVLLSKVLLFICVFKRMQMYKLLHLVVPQSVCDWCDER